VGYSNGASGKFMSDLYLGTAPAADEADTTALFRKDNGCQNTNQNENDFVPETALTATLYDLNSPPTPCSGVLISAIYGGGGDSSTVSDLGNDFVELFNAGVTPQSLNGLSIQYSGFDGTFDSANAVDLPNETLEPGQYFLFAGGSDTGTGPTDVADAALSPPPDDDDPSTASSYNASDEAGTVYLVNGTSEITSGTSTAIVDEVGYGNGAGSEESTENYLGAPAPDTSATTGLFRKDNGCANTLNNASDFSVATAATATLFDRQSPTRPCSSGLTGAVTVTTVSIALSGGGLYNPAGIATNNNGTAYFSDTYENVVGSIAGSNDSAIAGSFEGYGESGDGGPASSATLDSPAGLAVDAQGDVFIADTDDNVVREITPDGNVKLFAGNGTAGYSGDSAPAVEPVNTNISAWRRETFGDLTSAFQSGPGASTPPSDPNFTYSSVSNELNTQTANTSGSTKLPPQSSLGPTRPLRPRLRGPGPKLAESGRFLWRVNSALPRRTAILASSASARVEEVAEPLVLVEADVLGHGLHCGHPRELSIHADICSSEHG
jgi:hypothetical protein